MHRSLVMLLVLAGSRFRHPELLDISEGCLSFDIRQAKILCYGDAHVRPEREERLVISVAMRPLHVDH